MQDVTGVILAGGKSRRMGEDKRFLHVGETTLLSRSCSVMVSSFPEVLVITAQDSPPLEVPGCSVHQDLIPDCGSLGGLYTGLSRAGCNRIFVVACDMPFLNRDMIDLFVTREPGADIVIGRLPGGLQPLHAVYGKRVLPHLERMARTKQLKIQDIVSEASLTIAILEASAWGHLDPTSQSFRNVNTPSDLDAARAESLRLSR